MLRGTHHLEVPLSLNICPKKDQTGESWRPSHSRKMPSPTHLKIASCCIRIILAKPPSNNQEALRLAEAQVPNFQLWHSDALTSKLFLNAKDAARVCRLAIYYFTARTHVNATTTCRIHGGSSPSQREILPHERMRMLHSWYSLKLHVESFGQQHHQSLDQELWAISALQAYVLWEMVVFVCDYMEETAQEVRISLAISCALHHRPIIYPPSLFLQKRYLLECVSPATLNNIPRFIAYNFCRGFGRGRRKKSKANHEVHLHQELGIEDLDPPDYIVGVEFPLQPAWASTRHSVTDVYIAKRDFGRNEFHRKLNGPCDLCPLPDGAVCEPRERGKTLWEL